MSRLLGLQGNPLVEGDYVTYHSVDMLPNTRTHLDWNINSDMDIQFLVMGSVTNRTWS